MRIVETAIPGVLLADLEPIRDERGFFARSFCFDEFGGAGADLSFVQANTALSGEQFTLRGIHRQLPPHAEFKFVRCLTGSIFDVAVDLRPQSATYLEWVGEELSAENRRSLLVPPGCGHGYLTLAPNTEVEYWTTHRYAPDAVSGVRFDDSAIGIDWPAQPVMVSERDRTWPLVSQGL